MTLRETETEAGDLTKVRVVSVRRVFHNGEHNAFTDMSRFRGRFYLTFRSCPDGHSMHPTSSIIVLSSAGHDRNQPAYGIADRSSLPKTGRLLQGALEARFVAI